MSEAFAPALSTASATVSKTGIPSTSCPPLPGVTPATTFVPYYRLRRPWKRPSLPVRPWITRRVSLSTMIANYFAPFSTIVGSGMTPSTTRSPRSSHTCAASAPVQPTRASHGSISSDRSR